MKVTKKNILYMLRESNAIENEWDRYSLVTAHRAWKHLIQWDKLTPELIKHTHYLLMQGKPIGKKYIGDWRDCPVWIGGVQKNQPKIVIDSLMRDYCEEMNTLPDDVLRYHLKFESIHPFIDGNGRIGRMLMNWHSIKKNNELLVFTEYKKQEIYYPIFSAQERHLNKALEYAKKENHDDDYPNRFTARLFGKSYKPSRVT